MYTALELLNSFNSSILYKQNVYTVNKISILEKLCLWKTNLFPINIVMYDHIKSVTVKYISFSFHYVSSGTYVPLYRFGIGICCM